MSYIKGGGPIIGPGKRYGSLGYAGLSGVWFVYPYKYVNGQPVYAPKQGPWATKAIAADKYDHGSTRPSGYPHREIREEETSGRDPGKVTVQAVTDPTLVDQSRRQAAKQTVVEERRHSGGQVVVTPGPAHPDYAAYQEELARQQSFLGGYGIYLLAAGGLVGLLWFIKRKKK